MLYGNDVGQGVRDGGKIRIKFEVDTNPPEGAGFEHQYRLLPSPYEIALYDAPSLLAGKLHAVLCRAWKNRVKGRDLYDYVFFLTRGTPVNLPHLRARLIQSGHLQPEQPFALADLVSHLGACFDGIDYRQAAEDVLLFVRQADALKVWSAPFFRGITNQLTVSPQERTFHAL